MKTFSLELVEAFSRGLRSDFRSARNQQQLTALSGLRPSNDGLQAIPAITVPPVPIAPSALTGQIAEWPYPQLVRGREKTRLFVGIGVYEIDETDWSVALQTLYNLNSLANTYDISALDTGSQWHVADFGQSFLATNGNVILLGANQDPTEPLTQVSQGVYAATSETAVTTVCAFKGRAIYGLDLTKPLFNAGWQQFFTTWAETDSGFNWATINGESPTVAMLAWSGIGSKMLWPFQSSTALAGLLESGGWDTGLTEHPLIFEWMKQNDFGFMPLPFQGPILQVRSLASGVVIYGTSGIGVAIPSVVADAPTLAFRKLLSFGIASRNAAGGDEQKHIFIDKSGYLWSINAEFQIQRLGYREFLDPLLGTEIVITLDERERDFYISNGSTTFVLSSTGLAKTTNAPTSLHEIDGGLLGFNHGVDDTELSFTTDVIDFGNRDIKRVTLLELGLAGLSSPQFRVHYRLIPDGDFFITNWRVATNYGSCVLLAAGRDFKIEFKATISAATVTPKIDYLRIHWQQSGKHLIRGL